MAVQLIPAALIALRAVGMTAGRAGLMAAREMVRNPQSRRLAGAWAQRMAQRRAAAGSAPTGPVTPPPATPTANTQAAREFFQRAAKHYGTPRPSGNQLMEFASQEAQQKREQSERTKEATSGLRRLAAQALAAATVAGGLRLTLKSYEGGVREAAEAFRQLNPTVAAAAARFQREELLRQFARARQVGGSTAGLLAARSQLADAQQPFGIEFQNMRNLINTIGTSMQTAVIRAFDYVGLDDAMRMVNKWVAEKLGIDLNARAGELEFRQFLRDTSQGRYPRSPTPAEMADNGRRPPRGGR